MGNTEEPTNRHIDFPMQKYVNQGLSQPQILQIKDAFDSYEPTNGEIPLNKYRERVQESGNKELLNRFLGERQSMNFEEFFAMEKEVFRSQLEKNPTLLLETEQIQPVSFFCPYAQEVQRQEKR